ncbi:MAG: glycoside hydrolase family 65 protein [Alistipes sp.]
MTHTPLSIYVAILLTVCCVRTVAAGEEGWTVGTNDFKAPYIGAPVANGTIGILPWKEPFSIRHLMLNHVFDISPRSGVTQVLRGVNPFGLTMYVDGRQVDTTNIAHWQQQIDMRRAAHHTQFTADNRVEVHYSVVALRNMPHAGLLTVQLTALEDAEVYFENRMEVPDDYDYGTLHATHKSFVAGKMPVEMLCMDATSVSGGQRTAAAAMYIYDRSRFDYACGDRRTARLSIRLKKGESIGFALAGSVCTTRDFLDPFSETEREVIYVSHEGVDRVLAAHKRLWEDLWLGDIEIEGDPEAQRTVRFALFNLYSYARGGSALSISPMGLSSQGYNGHIFWDTELWMFPPMLLLNEPIARSMIDYRISRLPGALQKADMYGYKGALYPWESDDKGQEACPTFAVTGQFEHHISADVAIACWNYYCLTQDKRWLRAQGWPVLQAVADFWVSRAVRNEDGSYSILHVVGADEYAEGVDDNAFTNAAAIRALRNAISAARLCGEPIPAAWRDLARNIRILRSAEGVTLEYAGYDGQMIKQADVNLLGYPLGIVTDPAQLRRDMVYYDDKIDKQQGPAMSFSAFCVQYARLGDREKAEEMFRRCYQPNIRTPFGVLAETPTSQNPYFATCAGGLLQAVINGFGGLDVTARGVRQCKTVLPKSWKRLTIKGVGVDRHSYTVTQR